MNRTEIRWGAGFIAAAVLAFILGLIQCAYSVLGDTARLPSALIVLVALTFPIPIIPAILGLAGVLLTSLGITAGRVSTGDSLHTPQLQAVRQTWPALAVSASIFAAIALLAFLPIMSGVCFFIIGSEADPFGPLLWAAYMAMLAFCCSSALLLGVDMWRSRSNSLAVPLT